MKLTKFRKLDRKSVINLSIFSVIVLVVSATVFGLIYLQTNKVETVTITNVGSNSFSIVTRFRDSKSALKSTPSIRVDGDRVGQCSDVEVDRVCYSDLIITDTFAHVDIQNVDAGSQHEIEWNGTIKSKLNIANPDGKATLMTKEFSENVPVLERIYGRVIDLNENSVAQSVVIVQNENPDIGMLSAVTNSDGAYSISYLDVASDNFSQKISVLSANGYEREYNTFSFYNKPVADIVLEFKQEDSPPDLSLISSAYAANSCITDTRMGGIRAQCNKKIDWTENLSTLDCPPNEKKFTLGMIKHTTTTQFHKSQTIKLKLYDPETKKYVQDARGTKDLEVKNGGVVDMNKITLTTGKTYDIHAFDGSTQCLNTDGAAPSVTIGAPSKPGSGATPNTPPPNPNAPPPNPNTPQIPHMPQTVNMCKKIGENYATFFKFDNGQLQRASDLRMRWGLGLVTSTDAMYEYADTAARAAPLGMNMILRICFQGECNVNSGQEYGNKIVEIYDHLVRQGTLPQNGLFIMAGHNEPNVAEYRDPAEEARFIAEVIRTVEAAGILSQDFTDAKVKLLGPSLDLYRQENGQWNGSPEDPSIHPIYNAQTYIDLMLEDRAFAAEVNKLVGWGVNDYLDARAGGSDKVVNDVTRFTSFLKERGVTSGLFVTELGNYGPGPDFNPSFPWSDLANTIATLEAMDNVHAILLFNSFGSNQDSNFAYHRELWNNAALIESLFSNCAVGAFTSPQEGVLPTPFERPGGTGRTAPIGATGVAITGSTSSSGSLPGGAGLPGGTMHGSDPCLGGICYGNQYQQNAVALGGLINGNFEGAFVQDNSIDQQLTVPQFWHAWYQNKCISNMCGTYQCDGSSDALCRRPEYKQSTGFGDRVLAGGASSAQYFTSYGTHHAGMYQVVELEQGGSNTIDFYASASSWSDDQRCPVENGACVENGSCHCDILNKFIGRIGIDPTGGIDAGSPNIVWTEWQGIPNVQPGGGSQFTQFKLEGITSDSSRISVFVATNNEYPYRNSDSYWDGAELKINGNLAIGQASDLTVNPVDAGVGGGDVCNFVPGTSNTDVACWIQGPTDSEIANAACGDPKAYVHSSCTWWSGSEPTACVGDSCVQIQPNTEAGRAGATCEVYTCQSGWDGNMDNVDCYNVGNEKFGNCGENSANVSSETLISTNSTNSVLGSFSSDIVLAEKGEYLVTIDGYSVKDSLISNFDNQPLVIPVFQDLNGNGVKDEGEISVPNTALVSAVKISDVAEIELTSGLSIIALPLQTNNFNSAMDIVREVSEQGGYVTSVATYKNDGETPGWNVYTQRGNQAYSDDIALNPGDAVYVVVQEGVNLRLRGVEKSTSTETYLKQGWNLISITGADKEYTSKTLIEAINTVSGVNARVVSVWDSNRGRFVTYVLDELDSEFGEAVVLSEGMGVFVFIDTGGGYWAP